MKAKKRYHQFNFTERQLIERHKLARHSNADIGLMINRDRRSVDREIKRNSVNGRYIATIADQLSQISRLRSTTERWKLTSDMLTLIIKLMRRYRFSPETICNWCHDKGITMVSKTWIYRLIRKDRDNGGKLYQLLSCRGRRRKWKGIKPAGRGYIRNGRPISERPAIVDEKVRLGDGEIDTIEGKAKKSCLVTYVDRVTKLVKIMRVEGLSSVKVTEAIKSGLGPMSEHILTMTSDNGKEFARHEEIAKSLDCDFYFCDPYSSWQRGLNENTNRLIRAFFPKKTDFLQVSDREVLHVERLLNARPRKTLNWQTPNKTFAAACSATAS